MIRNHCIRIQYHIQSSGSDADLWESSERIDRNHGVVNIIIT